MGPRLNELMSALRKQSPISGIEMTKFQEIQRLAWWLLGYLFEIDLDVNRVDKPSKHRFLFRRHTDSLMLCSIYAAAANEGAKVSMKQLVAFLGQQPQYMSESTENVYIDDQTRGSIVQLYNVQLVAIFRKLIKVKEQKALVGMVR